MLASVYLTSAWDAEAPVLFLNHAVSNSAGRHRGRGACTREVRFRVRGAGVSGDLGGEDASHQGLSFSGAVIPSLTSWEAESFGVKWRPYESGPQGPDEHLCVPFLSGVASGEICGLLSLPL